MNQSIRVVIPAYKAANLLQKTIPPLLEYLSPEQILVLNDGIFDETEAVCNELAVPVLSHPENRGKGAALSTAFQEIGESAEWIITMDADGQHAPADLPAFFEAIDRAKPCTAIIGGARTMTLATMPPERIFSNRATSAALSLFAGQWIADSQCGYRAYRTAVVSKIICNYRRFEMESEVLLRVAAESYRITAVPIQTIYPEEGVSHISHLLDTLRWIRAVLSTKLSLWVRR